MAPEWHKKRPLYNVSCKCLLLAKPVLQPDPYLQGSLVFQFLGYRGKYRKMGKDVNCQSTIFNTNHSFLNTFCEAAILSIFHSLFKFNSIGAPGWRSRLSVRLQPGHDLAVREFKPRLRLMAQSLEPVSDSVSPSLSAPPPFMLCLSLSQK